MLGRFRRDDADRRLSRPIVMQASPQRDFETPISPRSQSAAVTISGQAGLGVFR
jgi:hypothetical protein